MWRISVPEGRRDKSPDCVALQSFFSRFGRHRGEEFDFIRKVLSVQGLKGCSPAILMGSF